MHTSPTPIIDTPTEALARAIAYHLTALMRARAEGRSCPVGDPARRGGDAGRDRPPGSFLQTGVGMGRWGQHRNARSTSN